MLECRRQRSSGTSRPRSPNAPHARLPATPVQAESWGRRDPPHRRLTGGPSCVDSAPRSARTRDCRCFPLSAPRSDLVSAGRMMASHVGDLLMAGKYLATGFTHSQAGEGDAGARRDKNVLSVRCCRSRGLGGRGPGARTRASPAGPRLDRSEATTRWRWRRSLLGSARGGLRCR